MEDGTEHIMTRVLPEVPVRQWVLSLPFQLRARVAYDASLFSAIVRIFVDEVFRLHAAQARELGVVAKPNSGAVACLQRFGSALNLNPHLHLVAIDGVYVRDEMPSAEAGAAALVFHALPPPSEGEVHLVSAATCRRVLKLLRRRGLTDVEGLIPLDELDATQQLAEVAQRQRPLFAQVDEEGRVRQIRDQAAHPRSGDVRGFSVHAGVFAPAQDTERRRRIIRYCLRPPFASAQVTATMDGRVAFQLRHPRNNGATHVVFAELAWMRKVAAILPPPGRHVVKYFGVLSSGSPLRGEVVPAPPLELELSAAAVLSVEGELGHVALPQRPRAASWAQLLRRVYNIDPMLCPRCSGKLKFIAAITEPSQVRRILDHLQLNDEPPAPRPRPRAPPELFDA